MRKFVLLVMCATSTTIVIAAAPAHDGNLDLSYGTFGESFQFFPGNTSIAGGAIAEPTLQPDGKLLLVSSKRQTPTNTDFGVIRLLTDGTIDTSLGNNGAAIASFDRSGNSDADIASGMALQPADGKILVSGYVAGDTSTGQDMAVARFTSSGLLDASFGNYGKAIVPFNLGNCPTVAGACDDEAYRVDLQADGKILLVGQAASSQTITTFSVAMAVARLTTSGTRDSTFGGGDGRVTLNFGNGDIATGYRARQLADGQHILAVGGANTTPGGTNLDFALARLDDHGNLDTSFGVGGQVTYGFDIGGTLTDVATDFTELPDGRLLVCGEALSNNPSNYDFACMRFLADGAPDPTFTPVLVPFDRGGDLDDISYAVRRDSQGRFVLAGAAARAVGNSDFAVTRLTADGVLDSSFGRNGIATFASFPSVFGVDYDNAATGVVIQPDDKIIVVGYATIDGSGNQQFQVLRLIGDTIFTDNFESN